MTDGPSAALAEQSRRRIGGRYQLTEAIGYGGMGRVYRAHDELLDRPVAVKLLDDPDLDGPRVAEASATEARAAARLSHPGIVQVFDVGNQDGTPYIVMELVPGQSLREVLRARGKLPARAAAELAAELADALNAAHANGLVHCDVKPGNIIVMPSGHAKIVDFGIARAAAARGPVPADEIRGSAGYVAPEQVRGEDVDRRTDVYALGAVLYEMLTGRLPFVGPTPEEVVAQRLVSDPEMPRALEPRITPGLEAIVIRSLARDPARRYATAADLRDALRAELRRAAGLSEAETQRIARPVVPPTTATVDVVSPPTTQRRADTRAPDRRPVPVGVRTAPRGSKSGRLSRPMLALALVVGAIVVTGVVAALRGSGRAAAGVPNLVGRRISEVPAVLVQAGISPGDVTVLTREAEPRYAATVVDQQPQPGLPREPNGSLQIAVGVTP